jgi:hypothetical protein
MPKKGVFRRFDIRLFLCECQKRHFRNVTSLTVDEHRIASTFPNLGLIGCELKKKVREIENQNHHQFSRTKLRKCQKSLTASP